MSHTVANECASVRPSQIRARTLEGASNLNDAFFKSIQSECSFSKNVAF